MALNLSEIKDRATRFSKEWVDAKNEDAEAKPFLVDFFNVFGISQRKVSTFEHRVKKLGDKEGYIDLLWKGLILVEMKSRGKNLDKAYGQAKDYIHGLKQHEIPKYILISDFENFILYDLDEDKTIEFKLKELVNNIHHFGHISGYQKKVYKEQDPANIKAAELMGKFHDRLKEIGYIDHPLEVFLVRILFCLFAEDTTIFAKQQFQDIIELRTNEDGSDLASKLQEIFQVLNTPKEKRFKNIDEQLEDFPYVNGKLFEESLPTASFDSKMRQSLLDCCYIDWSQISPEIFGSMFQSVMNPIERRNLGAHYTSEKNILKVVKPLFLDELWSEFESIKDNKNKLLDFHKKLSLLKFLDPACGCGNFLVITYRELRLLEIELLRAMNKNGQGFLNVHEIVWLDVDQFYGIEIEEFPARIAEVAMWLIDHQMNMLISQEFGQYFVRLPLKKAANIIHGNALRIDWGRLLHLNQKNYNFITNQLIVSVEEPVSHYETLNVKTQKLTKEKVKYSTKEAFDYVFGNPPFIGKSLQNEEQKVDMDKIFNGAKGAGVLDYVTAWYVKASELIQDTKTKVAFVSTNSISQGEQVGILWNLLFNQYKIKIHFTHRTFSWSNEAKGNAAVHVVIIGFANFDTTNKSIFEYENIKSEPHEIKAKNINPYLLEGKDNLVIKRNRPISIVTEMIKGSMPNDGGNYLYTKEEKQEFILKEPKSLKYFRRFIGGYEFLNNVERWCLWLVDADPTEIKGLPLVMDRIEKVRINRLESKRTTTQKDAATPMLFGEIRHTNSDYLAIPEVSSENRNYIPVGYVEKSTIASNKVYQVPNASLFSFGVLSSLMHNAWIRQISGRLKSDISYSTGIVYNNFPWPENLSDKRIKAIEVVSQKVLDARSEFPNSSLADLYNPLTMPLKLTKAHQELDKVIDLAYRPQPFETEAKRMAFLFELYDKYTANLFTEEKPKGKKKK